MDKPVALVIVDPQWDFCDPAGALYVNGAEKDMESLAKFVSDAGSRLAQIYITLDSHHILDVAHPAFWKDQDGKNPNPFTQISLEDVEKGKWVPFDPYMKKRMVSYLSALETRGKYKLTIWPPHCLIGTKGATVVPYLMNACNEWCLNTGGMIRFIAKGMNRFTEHYSAVEAEVPDEHDPSTQPNQGLLRSLDKVFAADIVVAGEAGSHCVAATAIDLMEYQDPDRVTLLEGCFSPVGGFEKQQADFLELLTKRGGRCVRWDKYWETR